MSEHGSVQTPAWLKRAGLVLGLLALIIILLLPAPEGLPWAGKAALASASLLAIWWMTEALPIPVTSLLPLLLFPLLGVMSMQEAASPYADQLVFLFLGGFILAMGVERSGLHKRIALHVIRLTGSGSSRLVLGFMIATAGLSMWMSNTATVMLMLPIAMAVLARMNVADAEETDPHIAPALLLGIAYAASIGGTGTLIGTPPNIVLAGVMRKLYPSGPEIGFVQWMLFGVPLVALFLPLTWLLLVRLLPTTRLKKTPSSSLAAMNVQAELAGLGKLRPTEKRVLLVFLCTAASWIFRAPLDLGGIQLPGLTDVLPQLTDAMIAIAAGVTLFFMPGESGARLFSWNDAVSYTHLTLPTSDLV